MSISYLYWWLREKVVDGYTAVRRKLSPPPPSINVLTKDTPPVTKDKKTSRPAKLTIPFPQVKGQYDDKPTRRASTTVTERPMSSLNVTRGKVGVASNSRRGTSPESTPTDAENKSLQREYKRGLSQDSNRGSLIMTPHPSKVRTLVLSYDRSRMKRPSHSSESPVAADPIESVTQSSESYIPRISLSVRSWSSLLARNYYRLNNAKLVGTFFINIILLTFKVCVCVCVRACVCISACPLFCPYWSTVVGWLQLPLIISSTTNFCINIWDRAYIIFTTT